MKFIFNNIAVSTKANENENDYGVNTALALSLWTEVEPGAIQNLGMFISIKQLYDNMYWYQS